MPPPDIATATYLTAYPRAKCLDGSPGYYYLRKAPAGGANASKWVFHLEGGGWCDSGASCASRATLPSGLGSSNSTLTGFTDVSELGAVGCNSKGCGALMLNDPAINEYTYDWNAVFMRYCDGMSFSGNQARRERTRLTPHCTVASTRRSTLTAPPSPATRRSCVPL